MVRRRKRRKWKDKKSIANNLALSWTIDLNNAKISIKFRHETKQTDGQVVCTMCTYLFLSLSLFCQRFFKTEVLSLSFFRELFKSVYNRFLARHFGFFIQSVFRCRMMLLVSSNLFIYIYKQIGWTERDKKRDEG